MKSLSAQGLEAALRTTGTDVVKAFEPQRAILQSSSAVLLKGRDEVAYGTVVSHDGWILTKASEIESIDSLVIIVDKTKYDDVRLVAMDAVWDVALLKIDAAGLVPVHYADSSDLPLGTWVVANGATSRTTRRLLPGIISAMTREVPAEGGAALGVVLEPGDGRLTVKEVRDDSGAEKAGVKMGDVLETINGTEIESIETLAKLFESAKAGDKVKLGIQRGNESLELEVELASKGELFGGAQEGNDRMSGSFSKRRSGFPRVIQHSIIANNASMGGPVLDLTGQCVGMNIARANRAETFAIPAEQLKELAERMIQETR